MKREKEKRPKGQDALGDLKTAKNLERWGVVNKERRLEQQGLKAEEDRQAGSGERETGRGPPQDQLTKLADEGKGLGAVLQGSPLRRRATPDVAAGP